MLAGDEVDGEEWSPSLTRLGWRSTRAGVLLGVGAIVRTRVVGDGRLGHSGDEAEGDGGDAGGTRQHSSGSDSSMQRPGRSWRRTWKRRGWGGSPGCGRRRRGRCGGGGRRQHHAVDRVMQGPAQMAGAATRDAVDSVQTYGGARRRRCSGSPRKGRR
jgi:hypothetical protein